MRRLLLILIVLLISVWLGVKISEDPGYALFVYQQWSVEMPLWAAFAGFVIFLLIFYIILSFFNGIEMIWLRLKNWLRLHRKYKAYSKTNQGLVDLLQGDWRSAERYLLDGASQFETPLVNYVAAAKAAYEQGAQDRYELYLRKAQDIMPSAELGIGLTRAQFQLKQGQLEQAMLTLNHLRELNPKHKVVLELLQKVYVRLSDWDELLKLLPALQQAKIITAQQEENFETHIYQELLMHMTNKMDNLNKMRDAWQRIPRKIQKNSEVICCYVKRLLSYTEAANEIEELILVALKKNWHEELVYFYGLVISNNPQRQLSHAEQWVKQHGYHSVLFLTLGRLCMRCQLWGKARSYFEQCLKANPRSEAYLEYGKLLEQLGEQQAAIDCYRQGLRMVSQPNILG